MNWTSRRARTKRPYKSSSPKALAPFTSFRISRNVNKRPLFDANLFIRLLMAQKKVTIVREPDSEKSHFLICIQLQWRKTWGGKG